MKSSIVKRNGKILEEVNTFFGFVEQTLYINVKNSEKAGYSHNLDGYTRFYNLSNSFYSTDKKFFRKSENLDDILRIFENGYELSKEQKGEVAIYFDCKELPNLMVSDLISVKFHDDKNLYTFRHSDLDKVKEDTYIGINFNP